MALDSGQAQVAAVLVGRVAVNLTAASAPELEILRDIAATRRAFRLGLAIEADCQPDGGDRPVGVLAELSDLGLVHVAIEPDADPSAAAYIRRPEEAAGPRSDEFLLRSRQARAPQMREVIDVMAVRPQCHKCVLARANQVGAPWLSRSVTSASARQIARTCPAAMAGDLGRWMDVRGIVPGELDWEVLTDVGTFLRVPAR